MPLFISIAKKPKQDALDLSRRLDAAAVATSENLAADALRATLAAEPNAVLAYPITSAGFDGKDHYFAYVIVGASATTAGARTIPLPEPVGLVYLCQHAARNLYREVAGEALMAAHAQLSKAETDYASAKSARDSAAKAVVANADDLAKALKDGASAVARRDALMMDTVSLGQAQLAAEHKLQDCLRAVHEAQQVILDIQTAHAPIHYVSKKANQALQATLNELVENAAVPLRKQNAFEEPYNSGRKERLTWSER